MFARDRKTPLAEWWWTIDKQLLSALLLLMAAGMLLSFAASPPVAERLGLEPLAFCHPPCRVRPAGDPRAAGRIVPQPSSGADRRRLSYCVGSIVLLWMTLRFGVEVKGARRWISFAGNTVQPSRVREAGLRGHRGVALFGGHAGAGHFRRARSRTLLMVVIVARAAAAAGHRADSADPRDLGGAAVPVGDLVVPDLRAGGRGRGPAVRRLLHVPALRQAHRHLPQPRGRRKHLPDRQGAQLAARGWLVRTRARRDRWPRRSSPTRMPTTSSRPRLASSASCSASASWR